MQAVDVLTDVVSKIFSEHISNAVYAAMQSSTEAFTGIAGSFADRCLESAQTTTPDVALDKMLGNVQEKRDLALSDLTKILVYTLEHDVSLTDARKQVYLAHAACVQLYNAVLAQKPPIIEYTVRSACPITVILVELYGKDAMGKHDEVYLLNPNLRMPHWIPAGTVLKLTAPRTQA